MDNIRWERFLTRQQLRGVRGWQPARRLSSDQLPLDTEEALVGLRQDDILDRPLETMTRDKLAQAHEEVQTKFGADVKQLAEALALIGLLEWHRRMLDLVRKHILDQAFLGGRGKLNDPKRIEGYIRREADFLSRFADEIARSDMSQAQIAARAALYGGTGRSAFYKEAEADLPEGYVINYEALDDESTCNPCILAEHRGPYLPGRGPFPGEVCLGRAHCRCIRRSAYDPAKYQWLRLRQG